MENRKKDACEEDEEVGITDLEALVPQDTCCGKSKKGGTVEKTVSTTDPDCGLFVKGEQERQFAWEAHTVCDRKGFILEVHVTAGNVQDSIAIQQ